MQKRRLILKEKKKISKECWNLDSEFFKWLEIRLKTYLKEAGKYVDLKYYKFAVDDKELNQVLNAKLFNDYLVKVLGGIFSYFVSIINLFGNKCQII